MNLTKLHRPLLIAGAALLVLTVILAFLASSAAPSVLMVPKAADQAADALVSAIGASDYETIQSLLYGHPDLGIDRAPEDAVGQQLWSAYQDRLTCESVGGCYAEDSGIVRDVRFTYLDISAVTGQLGDVSEALLTQRVEAAVTMDDIYDENHEYREAFIMEILNDAVSRILDAQPPMIEKTVTLQLTYQDGQWLILPDQALLGVISGGVAG